MVEPVGSRVSAALAYRVFPVAAFIRNAPLAVTVGALGAIGAPIATAGAGAACAGAAATPAASTEPAVAAAVTATAEARRSWGLRRFFKVFAVLTVLTVFTVILQMPMSCGHMRMSPTPPDE
ncbi:hypothetical protein GCM10010334_34740 [Streptomyces finlayi]|uniref:Uncharacterized protein n=1 Tax=Streptomyces finlayi TaxID=67296 RepID=A0A918WYK0_9ACTN|nr:hypothetical protein GCM10010334_34740 [Streptomyces finlayi]